MAVRRESVELSLVDADFTTGMAKAAAATALLDKSLHDLDGSTADLGTSSRSTSRDVDGLGKSTERTTQKTKDYSLETAVADERTKRLRSSLQQQARAMVDAEQGVDKLGKTTRGSSDDLNKYTGRLNLLATAATTLGPALIPISATAIPAIAGLTAGIGAAAGAVGVAALAFHGLGGSLKALDAYQLQPTAANLQKLQDTFGKLSPAAQEFVTKLDALEAPLKNLQALAQAGMFPGMTQGLNSLMALLPDVETVVKRISTELGTLSASAGSALANDPEWQKFFTYIKQDAAPTLDAFAHATGNVITGFADLLVAFRPLSDQFAHGLLSMSQGFREWAANLSGSNGFQHFVDYIRQNGPEVEAFFKAAGDALVGLAHAAAPWGSTVLPILTDVLDVFAAIANSPIGPVLFEAAAGMAAFNLASSGLTKILATTATGWTAFGTSATLAGTQATTAAAEVEAASARLAAARTGLVVGESLLIGGQLGQSWFNSLSKHINPQQDTLGTSDNVDKVINSLQHGWQSKWRDPTAFIGFNPEGFGDKSGVQNTDSGLAALVNSGQMKQAATDFQAITDAANKQGISLDTLKARFPQYEQALAGATAGSKEYGGAVDGAASAANSARARIQALAAAMNQQRDAALSAFDSETQYRQALKDAQAQAAKSNAGIKGNTDAALANRGALSGLAAAWNNQSDAVKNNVGRFHEARAAFIQTAEGMGVSSAAAKKLADRILEIPKAVAVKVSVQNAQANSMLWETKRLLDQLHDKHINVTTSNIRIGGVQQLGYATGGYIAGPGGPTEDRIPAMLSNGEYVVRAAAVDKYGLGLMESINAMHLASGGYVQRFANGGHATTPHWSDYSPAELRTVAAALKASSALDKMRTSTLKQVKAYDAAAKKAVDREKAAVDVAKQHRQAILQDISSIRQSVATRYQSNVFGGVDTSSIAYQIDPKTGKYVSATQAGKLQDQGVIAGLQQDIANAKASQTAADKVQAELKGSGLSKDAIAQAVLYMEQNASVAQMQALASSPDLAQQYAKLYTQRQAVSARVGQSAANMVDGADLKAATKHLATIEGDLKAAQRRARLADQRANRMEKHVSDLKNKVDHLAGDIASGINTASKKGK